MNLEAFLKSLEEKEPSKIQGNDLVLAIWYVIKGDWNAAHEIVQGDDSQTSSWIHGLIHKIEGDIGNARYWYGQAQIPFRSMLNVREEALEIFSQLTKGQ